jgi:hypothetical protein
VSLYDALGVSSDASPEELRRAFVGLARRFHPDRHVGGDPAVRREAERRMREVTEAWAVLGDPQRRRYYDLGLGDPVARGGRGGAATGGGAAQAAPRQSGTGRPAGGGGAAGRSTDPAARPWRSYASPGPASTARSSAEQLLLLSPVLLLAAAGLAGMAGAIIGWPPFYGLALVCLIVAAACFFMLPIWAMTRGRRAGRGPKRSY